MSERKPLERLPHYWERARAAEEVAGYYDHGDHLEALTNILNDAIDRINQLEARLELGHYHMTDDDPLSTGEDIAYVERDEDE